MMDKNTKKLFKAAKQNLTQEVVTLIEKKGVPTTAVNKKRRTVGHYAVRNNNFDMLKYIVEKDPSILRIEDDHWYNIFHLAVKRGALNMVKYLVEKHNEDILQTFFPDSGEGGTALHRAVKFGHTDLVKYFIDKRNVDVNGCVVGAQKQTPLFMAIRYKHPDIVNYFIDERNANLTLVDSMGENILYPAVRNNDLNLVKHVLDEKKGVPTTAVNKEGRTVGHYAVRNNNFDMLKYVVDKDPSILRKQDDNWYNIFHLAVNQGALNMVKYLVENHNEDILQTFLPDSGDTGTALHRAVKFGHTDMVKYFIGERNVDPNGDTGAQKQPPLFLAVKYKHPDIVNYLIDERNANLTLVDSNGENILYEAVRKGDLNLVKRVLDEKKAQIDIDSQNKEGYPLIWELLDRPDYYVYINDAEMEMLKYLVEQKNANLNVRVPACKSCTWKSPLVYKEERNERIVKYLAEHGTDITTVNFYDQNLLHGTSSEDFCKYLIKHGVNVNQKDGAGKTPLHQAILKNHYEVCVCLIEGGADWKKNLDRIIDLERIDLIKYLVKKMKIDLNEPDEAGKTPLHRAAQRGQYNGCQLLVNYGAKVDQQDKLGNTALHYAAGANQAQICRYLLNRGANAGIKNKNSQLPAEMVSDQDDEALKNVFKQSTVSKRNRRGAVDYFAAAAVNQLVGSYENGQQKIASGDLNRESYYWGRETSFPIDDISPHLQNWFLFTQLLFRGAMNFVRSREGEQGSLVLSVPRASLIEKMDPVAEDAIGALPDFRIQK